MPFSDARRNSDLAQHHGRAPYGVGPGGTAGKRTLTEALGAPGGVLQRRPAAGARAAQLTAEHMGNAALAAGSGGGAPLEPGVQAKMERSLGADFSAVRIHEGDAAPSIGAEAFTHGHDIHFAPGRYQPESAAGQELLGHELAHVVQQGEGRVSGTQAKGAINAEPSLEAEADALGARAAAGLPALRLASTSAVSPAVQRRPFDFGGQHVDPQNFEAFQGLVRAFGQAPGGHMRLPALHQALVDNEEPEAAQYVADFMQHVHGQHMKAPDQLEIETGFRDVLATLWQRTAQTGDEHGGSLREDRETKEAEFDVGQGSDASHFTFDTSRWNPATENLQAQAHTHPSGSSFSGADLADQHRSASSVEYIRTATHIFAIVKTGEYWNRIRALLDQFSNDPAVLSQRIRAHFDASFNEAADHFMRVFQRAEGQSIEEVTDLCFRFATQHAVKAYARSVHAGYYEGAVDDAHLTRKD